MAADPSTDVLAYAPRGPGSPLILHELLQVVDHSAYHLGPLIVLRRLLGAWREWARLKRIQWSEQISVAGYMGEGPMAPDERFSRSWAAGL
jgi:hypothetical protein